MLYEGKFAVLQLSYNLVFRGEILQMSGGKSRFFLSGRGGGGRGRKLYTVVCKTVMHGLSSFLHGLQLCFLTSTCILQRFHEQKSTNIFFKNNRNYVFNVRYQ